jgi:hypothetical protein
VAQQALDIGHFQAPLLCLPVVERGFTDADPAAEILHRNSGLPSFNTPTICSSLKRLRFMALLLSQFYTDPKPKN